MIERNEELLENLKVAQRLIHERENLNAKRCKVCESYLPINPKYKKIWKGFQPIGWKVLLFFLLTFVLGIIFLLIKPVQIFLIVNGGLDVNAMWAIMRIIEIILAIAIIAGIQPMVNKRIKRQNRGIGERAEANDVHNKSIFQNIEAPIIEQQESIAQQFYAYCSKYPQHYCNSDAAEFFVRVVESGQAINFSQAVDRYEMELERRRQMQREKEIDKMNRDHQKVMEIEGAFAAFSAMSMANSANRTANSVEIHNAVYHRRY